MKYALVTYEEKRIQDRGQFIINIGNYMQWLAIAELYNYMALDDNDIVKLSSKELQTYKGERLILPINYMWAQMDLCQYVVGNHVSFSDDIIPVFLGISIKQSAWEWTEEWVKYFKRYEPIGCRDYATWKKMNELGISAYLAGCLTITFPIRNRNEGNTTYFVEAPKALKQYIPDELKKECKFVQHQQRVTEEEFYSETGGLEMAKNVLEEYSREAKVVITSRLHCALPCMALGIPVILVKEYFGYPFDLQRKFLPFYAYQDFENINWKPQQVDLEQYKKIALECAKKRLLGEDAQENIARLHAEYASLYKDGYIEEKMGMEVFENKIRKLYKENDTFDYAIWGISDNAEWIYQYIKTHYPKANLVKVIDNMRVKEFHGILSEVSNVLLANDDLLVIAATINVSAEAMPFFAQIGKSTNKYICVTEGIMEDT